MADSRRVQGLNGLQRAFDEVRFGAARTLNLRESLPTGAEAARRAESWLRQHQVQQSAELLVITGRGNNSQAGIAVVREAALDAETRQELRILAERSLDALGIRERGPFVESEMLRLFGALAPTVGSGPEREAQLRLAIRRAMSELD